MKTCRQRAIELASERESKLNIPDKATLQVFGIRTFNDEVMKKALPKEIYTNLHEATLGKEKIKDEYADTIALAMKEWATSYGATHFCHWFQPQTSLTAEKHDSFLEWHSSGQFIEKFSGKQLIQGEPDASSFPSGGLRSTFEARGYTGWDPTSPPFLWKGGDGFTLFIPSVFFSWTGAVLDNKIPLLRSDKKLEKAVFRVLELTGIAAGQVYSTVGMEQEYFIIDRALRNLRPDLILTGRTVIGAAPAKGQELQDHYFGAVKDRILRFMKDFEQASLELGIPVKTRHNEVAPAQHEVAPVFERASIAADHNILMMELMRQIANKHGLACLLHEKPFKDFNGSGKHCNWSISTDTGINLLDPTDTPENNLHFLILLTAVLMAVHRHSDLLRASIGTFNNDLRLGGHEAPPAIISVYMGAELDALLNNIEKGGKHPSKGKVLYDLGLDILPKLLQDNTDRNRTSPFAFTGNKFEFRAVGSSSSAAFSVTVVNAIVAEAVNELMDEIEDNVSKRNHSFEKLLEAILPVLQKAISKSKEIRFNGDNYSEKWVQEAKKRKLSNIHKSCDSFGVLLKEETEKVFAGILSKEELASKSEILWENYVNKALIDLNVTIELVQTFVIPASCDYLDKLSSSLQKLGALKIGSSPQKKLLLKEIDALTESALELTASLRVQIEKAKMGSKESCAKALAKLTDTVYLDLRTVVDNLERLIPDESWTLPKYRELLYIV